MLRQRRPALTMKDCQLTGHALRQFFLAFLKSRHPFVSMPAQVVDDLWHEFILQTKNYEHFCRCTFGRFLHHSPATALGWNRQINAGLRRVGWHACGEENIHLRKPTRLPLLFAIDAKFDIADGFGYGVDCEGMRRTQPGGEDGRVVYCGGDIGSAGMDGSTEGVGDSGSGDSTHAGRDAGGGHGCGGHGCGGGGCGGGGCEGGGD